MSRRMWKLFVQKTAASECDMKIAVGLQEGQEMTRF